MPNSAHQRGLSDRPSAKPSSAQRLRELREAAGLSRSELAARTGIASHHLSKMENDSGLSKLPTAYRVVGALGISLQDFFGERTGPEEYPPEVTDLVGRGVHPLRALRWRRGLGPDRLAAECGVSVTHIGRIECGDRLCSATLLFKLARLLQVSADLLGRDLLAQQRKSGRASDTKPATERKKARSDRHGLATAFALRIRPHVEKVLADHPVDYSHVADRLNDLGMLTQHGQPWQAKDVWTTLRALGLQAPRRRFITAARGPARAKEKVAAEDSEGLTAEPEGSFIGSRLRQLRQRKGITLVDLSARTGVAPGAISMVERRRQHQSLKIVLKLAGGLDVSLDALAGPATGAHYPERAAVWIREGTHPLRAARWSRRLTLDELSARTGINASLLSQMEAGQRFCNAGAFFELAAALEISADLLAKDALRWQSEPSAPTTCGRSRERRRSQVDEFAERVRSDFEAVLGEAKSYAEMVVILNRDEVPALWDGKWTIPRAQKVLKRLSLHPPWRRRPKRAA